jgi:protein-tyrosine phosphatase
MADPFMGYRRASKGWRADPVAAVHPMIVFGAGEHLTPAFARKHNITHVVNCAFDEDSPAWFRTAHPRAYACMDAVDSLNADITKWFPKFEAAMDAFLMNRASRTVFVHCQCGINRSGFLTLMYACKKFGYTFDGAVRCILKQRPCALTNPAYMRQARAFVKNLA